MIDTGILLFILAALLGLLVWYIGTHSIEETCHKRKNQRAKPATRAPAYEPDDGPLTAKQIEAIKKLEPQGRGKFVSSTLF